MEGHDKNLPATGLTKTALTGLHARQYEILDVVLSATNKSGLGAVTGLPVRRSASRGHWCG